jgi:hypothetical protein
MNRLLFPLLAVGAVTSGHEFATQPTSGPLQGVWQVVREKPRRDGARGVYDVDVRADRRYARGHG